MTLVRRDKRSFNRDHMKNENAREKFQELQRVSCNLNVTVKD